MNTMNNLSRTLKMKVWWVEGFDVCVEDGDGECTLAVFCISSSFEFHVHQERCAIKISGFLYRKTVAHAARPCLIIQQFQSHLCHFMFAHFCISYAACLILWQDKEQACFLRRKTIKKKKRRHSWPFLSAVGDMTTCSSSEKDGKIEISKQGM